VPGTESRLDGVRFEAQGRIGRILLDRPEALNALSAAVQEALTQAPEWFAARPDISVVVVTGVGPSFSAGADMSLLRNLLDQGASTEGADLGRRMAAAVASIDAVTIAAIRGHCVGGGIVLAAACDLRVAAADARFSIPELDLGIPLGWGGVPVLVRELGPALAKELVLTCRTAGAAELADRGFLNRVVPDHDLEEATKSLAEEIAARPRSAVRADIRSLRRAADRLVDPAEWSNDAASLTSAYGDPESVEAARRHLEGRGFG
jgi:enoyl-CoA hydratase/carnithine racemase